MQTNPEAPTRSTTRKGAQLLGEHPIDVVLLATDLEPSKEFHAGNLGLEILYESEEEITYKCGGDSQPPVTRAPSGRLTSKPDGLAGARPGRGTR
jgi:hypothetical protein